MISRAALPRFICPGPSLFILTDGLPTVAVGPTPSGKDFVKIAGPKMLPVPSQRAFRVFFPAFGEYLMR